MTDDLEVWQRVAAFCADLGKSCGASDLVCNSCKKAFTRVCQEFVSAGSDSDEEAVNSEPVILDCAHDICRNCVITGLYFIPISSCIQNKFSCSSILQRNRPIR